MKIWIEIPGFINYLISNDGDIFNKMSGRFLRISNPSGQRKYRYVNLSKNKIQITKNIHRIVCRAFIGKCPEGYEVNHKDGNKFNNAILNLEYVTRGDNLRHAYRIGLRYKPVGIKNGNAILNNKQIKYIKRRKKRFKYGFQVEMSHKFNVSESAIRSILKNQSWSHL